MKNKYPNEPLTYAELDAILRALGNTTDHNDAMDAVFPNGTEKAACYRGISKLRHAWAQGYRERKQKGNNS